MARPRGRSTTCSIMEGYLTIPPDRGTILGRAVWKTRYVVIGSAQGEVNDGRSQSSISSDGITYLSIYKNPDDWEPSQQYAVSNITQCQVQMVAHRKQGPALPTLVLSIAPDPLTEKVRKRRSSRAATLVSSKENGPTALWFRTEGEAPRLHEWARCIQSMSGATIPELPMSPMSPMSPMTPSSPSFNNPFVPFAPKDAFDSSSFRPPSAPKTSHHHKASSSLHLHKERPLTISDAPSLRSRRSDLSSLTTPNAAAAAAAAQGYTSIHPPAELPSPAESNAESYRGFIEGWTTAQGRSSMLSSPVRTIRDSSGSNPSLSPAAVLDSGSPPGRGETILDRAFQMKYIPGSDQQIPGEEKLSSLARFEALMKEVDAQRQHKRQSVRPMNIAPPHQLKSGWDLDETSDEEASGADSEEDEDEDEDDDEEGPAMEQDLDDNVSSIRPDSRRTTIFPAGGPQTPSQSPRSQAGRRSPVAYNPETLAALSSDARGPGDRRMHAHTLSGFGNLSLAAEQQQSLDASPGRSSIDSTISEESVGGLNPASAYRMSTVAEGQQRRQSTTSFTEFTRRLSSTSSMLLAQPANACSDPASESQGQSRRSSVMQPRAAPAMFHSPSRAEAQQQDRSEKCKSWRSSVGSGFI